MKVNPKTVKFVLDLVAALAVTAAGVVAKYYIDVPQDYAHGLKRLCACFYIEEGALWKKNLIILYFSNRQFRK